MATIILKAKVKLFHESDMVYPEGVIPDDKARWVYRETGFNASDIYRVIRYNSTKTIIKDIWEDSILIDEPFQEVYNKWSQNKTEDLDLSPIPNEEEE